MQMLRESVQIMPRCMTCRAIVIAQMNIPLADETNAHFTPAVPKAWSPAWGREPNNCSIMR
jgi:hypothetical protein